MKPLEISKELKLPVEVVTQMLAFLGRRGSGKSYASTKLAELMLQSQAQIIALDPVGVWWGLRLLADGKTPGFPIPVFGGLHSDIPLEPSSGALIADLIVDKELSAILDVSQMIKSEQTRFATDFANQFFQRKKANPSAVHLFIEECQEFIPQNPMRDESRMLHNFERLIKLGRNFGIGASLISQRPQEVNKKALNQAECLFAFQMTGPQERKALENWIADKGVDEDIAALLPRLEVGHPRVWSPQWLKISKTVHVAKKKTFDASETPKVGAKRVAPKELSPVDVEELRAAMQSVIERAEENNPAKLKKQLAAMLTKIKELERDLQSKGVRPDGQVIEWATQAGERNAEQRLKQAEANFQRELASMERQAKQQYDKMVKAYEKTLDGLRQRIAKISKLAILEEEQADVQPLIIQREEIPVSSITYEHASRPIEVRRQSITGNGKGTNLGSGERKILTVLAQYPEGRTKTQIAILSGYSHKGGAFNNYLSALRSKGYIVSRGDRQQITDDGLLALGDYEPLPTGRDLANYWMGQLGKAERSILQTLLEQYPKDISKETVGRLTGYEPSGGGFNNAVSKLRTLELIEGRGELKASHVFFE